MGEVNGVNRRHFSNEEEEALQRDESTSSIVKRDARTNVDIHGTDHSWVATKHHQQDPLHHPLEWGKVAVAVGEGLGMVGVHLPLVAEVALPLAGFGLGLYALSVARENGDEQARALAKDNAHVALIGALDLPPSYKASRLDGEYKHVAKRSQSPAAKMTEALIGDKKGIATLQLHADRGMNAARDAARSGMTVEAFLKQNPKVAESYEKDAAFREGFDAYRHAREKMPPNERKAFETRLDERDGWYAQSQISFRV